MNLRLTSTPIRLAFAPLLAFMALATNREYLCDFWHHLARGEAIVRQGRLVNEDLFTFTVPGQTFQDVNWLTQVGYHLQYQLGGLDLVQICNALLVATALAIVVGHAARTSKSATIAAAIGIFTFLGCWQVLTIRPQSISLLLFAAEYLALDLPERNRRWLFVPPIIASIWVNTHGAFPLAWVLVGIYLAVALLDGWQTEGVRGLWTAKTRFLALCLAATAAATLLNPYGWTVYEYVGATSARAAGRRIDEWVRPSLNTLIGQMWLASMIAALVVFFRSPRKLTNREALLLLAFLPIAASSVRMVVWWFFVLAPIFASSLAELLPARWRHSEDDAPSWANTACAAALAVAALFCLPGLSAYNPLVRHKERVESQLAAAMRDLPPNAGSNRIFSRLEWGEYLGWSLAGTSRVFIDGRVEIIPDNVWADYAAITTGQDNWHEILNRYAVDCLVLDAEYHARTGLLAHVERSSEWTCVRREGPAIVYARRAKTGG
jgi:hypothetical protein